MTKQTPRHETRRAATPPPLPTHEKQPISVETRSDGLADETRSDETRSDETDESVLESFPASDAPTGWAGRDIAPQEREAEKAP